MSDLRLAKSKIQFRRALQLLSRYYQRMISKSQLKRYDIPNEVFSVLLQKGLIKDLDGGYLLTEAGLKQASVVFPALKSQTETIESSVDACEAGFVFISAVTLHGNTVETSYLANESGDVTNDVNKALFCVLQDWQTKKNILKAYDVRPLQELKKIN